MFRPLSIASDAAATGKFQKSDSPYNRQVNWNYAAGVALAFLVGAGCRWLNVPVPAPPTIYGVALILCITLGYIAAGKFLGD
jgi:XapX domain-containing protein